jgi:hypothetical protein
MDSVGGGGGGGKAEPGLVTVTMNHHLLCSSFPSFFLSFVRGTHTPRFAHSARWGRVISFVVACTQGRRPVSFVLVYIPLRGGGRKTRIKQTNNNYNGQI